MVVTVIYRCSCSDMAQLVSCLAQCSFSVNSITLEQWIESGNISDTNVVIVLVDRAMLSQKQTRMLGKDIKADLFAFCDSRTPPALSGPLNQLKWPCGKSRLKQSIQLAIHNKDSTPFNGCEYGPEYGGLKLLGRSPALKQTLFLTQKFARCNASVLIEGGTGTGKELVARALHYLSPRKDQPFIPMNCASFPDSLFDNELFGHSSGAFTDAKNAQPGLITQAQDGSLFLDEVDCLSLKAQASLLRFLQDKQFRPLGSSQFRQSKVSIIAACNCDLQKKIKRGEFRSDLYFRLNVAHIRVPGLQQRPEDIPLLAEHFLQHYCAMYDLPLKTLHADSIKWLEDHHWPGNIRELENMIHQEVLLSEDVVIQIDPERYHLQGPEDRRFLVNLGEQLYKQNFQQVREKILTEFERKYLHQLMQETRGNISQAARIAKKERRSIGRLLQKHGIKRGDYIPHSHSS